MTKFTAPIGGFFLALMAVTSPALAQTNILAHNLAPATTPFVSGTCIYADQFDGGSAYSNKSVCSGWAAALGAVPLNGDAGLPSALNLLNATGLPIIAGTTGTLSPARGGTGQTAYTDGQLLIGNTATGGLSKATLIQGANVTITNGPGTITIASSGGGGGAATNGSLNDILTSSGLGGFGTPITPASGITAFLAAPTSDNLLIALTTKTGTGLAVFGTSPTLASPILVTPNLGTPTAANLTNATNVPMGAATGTLLSAHGGTGQTSWSNGQLPIGNTATGGLTPATITAGANVTITNGNGSIIIAATTGSATAGGSNGQYQINSGGALAGRGLGTGLADDGTNLVLTGVVNDQTAGAYPVVAGDAQKTILVGAFTYTLPQAGSAGFGNGWGGCFLNTAAGNATVNTTTSLFKGAGGATSLTLRPKAWACPSSDGTNYQTVFGSTDGGDLTAATVTNAKLATMPQHTYKGNNTGSTAAPLDLTQAQVLTDLFDPLGSAQGTVYFRGATGLVALGPGTNGQVFTTSGAAADPSWTTVAGTGNMVGSAATTSGNLLQSNNTGGTLTTATDSGIAASALVTASSTNTLSNKTIDCTTSTCTNFPRSLNWGWIPTVSPNEDTIYTADGAVTVLSIRGTVVAPIGAAGTVQFNKASDTKACNDGTSVNLATGTFDANGTANTNQTLTLIGSPVLSAGDRICALTTGTGWTTGAGHAGMTIRLRAS